MRKVKDAKDLSTNELIYFKGHAKATFMSDGRTVEDAINDIPSSGGGGDDTAPSVYKWQWNGEANGTLEEGEFEKILNADIVLIAKGEGYMFPATKVVGTSGVALGAHFGFNTSLQSYSFSIFATGMWNMVTQIFSVEGNYPVVNVTELNDFTLSPNTYYKAPTLGSPVSVLFGEKTARVVNEYIFEFGVFGSVSLSMPQGVVWANGETPPMTDGKVYVISVIDDLAVFAEF